MKHSLRMLFCTIAFITMFSCYLSVADEAEKAPGGVAFGGFQLSIAPEKNVVSAGEPVIVLLTLKNVTTKPLDIYYWGPYSRFAFEVKNKDGEIMPSTNFGRLREAIWSLGIREIKGGEEMKLRLAVNRVVDMTPVGDYTITIQHGLPNLHLSDKDRALEI